MILLQLGRPLWRPREKYLQFLIKKRKEKFSCIFFQFFVIKTLHPYPYPELDPDTLDTLDPDPYSDPDSMNPDPEH